MSSGPGRSRSARIEQLKLDLDTAARKRADEPAEKPEVAQQALYDLRLQQLELEMQIEELRRAQHELDVSRARYFDLYEMAPVGYCTLDEGGSILQANLTAVRMLGSPMSGLLSRSLASFVLNEDQGSFRRVLEGAAQSAELCMKREDGMPFWADVVVASGPNEAGVTQRRVVMSDVTVRRTAEAARLETQARYRELFSRASDGIAISTIDGVLLEGNEAFARMHGLTLAELSKQNLSKLGPEGASFSPEHLRRLALGGVLTFEAEHLHRDGSTFPLETSISEISVGGVPHLLGFYREIAERRRLAAAFAQNDRLTSMGILSAGIAHEINNPLTYVLSNVESVAEELPLVFESIKRALEARTGEAILPTWEILDDLVGRARGALEGALRIKTITRALGSFSRTERSDVGSVDVNAALETATTMAHNEIKYRARLIKHLGEVPRVLASEGKLVQVLLNLLTNAAQAITEGDIEANSITLRTWVEGEAVFAEVLDTGCGIPPENLSRIFEPFFTTKHHGVSGAGLGLSIAKALVAELGGELRVQSAPGRTSFVVKLPVSTADHPVTFKLGPPPAVVGAPAVHGRILVVDDEEPIRRIIQRALGREHEVVCVASGKQARELLLMDQAFDVILCDLMMPEMTGMELHAWLTVAAPRLAARVIFISGGAFTPTASAYLASVENQLVTKPFFLGELMLLMRDRVAASRAAPRLSA